MIRSRLSNAVLFGAMMLVMATGALALRLPRLAHRPMHTDEAVHAVKLGILFDHGRYEYDPHEYHGPTLYYFTLPLLWLSHAPSYAQIRDEVPLRLVPVIFGVGLIFLLFLVGDGLGRPATLLAAALTALSPAMVFYSRYYIQEMLLVFFTFLVLAAGWRYTHRRRLGWALLAGGGLGLMFATKETCIIAWAAMAGSAWLVARGKQEHGPGEAPAVRWRDRICPWHIAAAALLAVLVASVMLTAFFSRPAALIDSLRAYAAYGSRAGSGNIGGSDSAGIQGVGPHNHPWYFYLRLLLYTHNAPGPAWSEALILGLALAGIVAALRRRPIPGVHPPLARFLAFYTLIMTTGYALIPYKTPWCLLGFLHGMILMAGIGGVALWHGPVHGLFWRGLRWPAARALLVVLLLAAGAQLGRQAWRGTFVFDSDPRNPYVYSHTSADLLKLGQRAEALARVYPDGHRMIIKVVVPGSDYWPLPWYLRRFERVGYWTAPDALGTAADGPLIITTPAMQAALEKRLREKYVIEFFGLRPDVLLVAYIREDVWAQFLAAPVGLAVR